MKRDIEHIKNIDKYSDVFRIKGITITTITEGYKKVKTFLSDEDGNPENYTCPESNMTKRTFPVLILTNGNGLSRDGRAEAALEFDRYELGSFRRSLERNKQQ